jgi:hypothetical protein
MTFVITCLAAIIVSVIRLLPHPIGRRLRLGVLALIYSGAALMWCVDAILSVVRGGPFIATDTESLRSDCLLGGCVILLGLIAWGGYLLFTRRKEH